MDTRARLALFNEHRAFEHDARPIGLQLDVYDVELGRAFLHHKPGAQKPSHYKEKPAVVAQNDDDPLCAQ